MTSSPSSPADSSAAILATAVVPWTEGFEFDEPVFRRQVHTIARNLTRHIYVFGTAGEGYAVSERQFDQITMAFWSASQERILCRNLRKISGLPVSSLQSAAHETPPHVGRVSPAGGGASQFHRG
jgi:hypothetical protein